MTAAALPSTGAVTGLSETLAFFRDPSFSQRRFRELGDVFETKLLAQSIVFIRGERAISDLLKLEYSLQGWWPKAYNSCWGAGLWQTATARTTKRDEGWYASCSPVQP